MYVDYEYYLNEYGGTSTPYEQFRATEKKAEAYIKKLTYVRGDIFAIENDAVKDAVCAVTDAYHAYSIQTQNGTIKSENNDGYSVTYVTEQQDGESLEELIRKKAYAAASTYLLPTGWLSRKVECSYDYKHCNNYL